MNPHLVKLLHPIAAVAPLLIATLAMGQSVGAPTDAWQPYRDTNVQPTVAADSGLASAVAGAAPASMTTPGVPADPEVVRTAQLPPDMAVCPQPVFAAPPCDPSVCYPSPMAPQLIGVAPMQMIGAVPVVPTAPDHWYWRVLPEGVIWQSYWAGVHEPRLSAVTFRHDNGIAYTDPSLGGRASLIRYGTEGTGRPQGFELQAEGAAFPRLNLDEEWDLDSTDYRAGFPLIYGRENWQAKFGYYHLSSHMGDEFIIRQNSFADRINYSRDALALALSYFPHPAWRFYAEMGWAFYYRVSEPWEFQFGVDISEPGPTGPWGTPFIAINGHLREEVDFGGNVVAQAGWLWRGDNTHVLRLGFHYYNGKSSQYEFFNHFDEQIGGGIWFDF